MLELCYNICLKLNNYFDIFLILANNCECAEAFNMLGMLLERQGIFSASLKAYER